MNTVDTLARLRGALEEELKSVTDWWLGHVVDTRTGDIAGEVSGDNRRNPGAGWSLVYIARLLWFFSAVYRHEPRADCRAAADRCLEFLGHFHDREHGGLYWTLDAGRRPLSRKKQSYGQAFAVYGLSEYALAFGGDAARDQAGELVALLERHARDSLHGGYLEALDTNWQPLSDVRLGENDVNADKTMNTHLHILEAYTTYFRARPDPAIAGLLGGLADLFLRRFQEPRGSELVRYCGRDWSVFPAGTSFGHDIEAGWLLCEAANVLGNPALQARARAAAVALTDGVLERGLDAHGAVIHERALDDTPDSARIWWVQAEALVGLFNAWQISGERCYLDACLRAWDFVRDHQRDPRHGEWLWYSALDVNAPVEYKAGAWKGPYHNGRALLELIERIDGVTAG